jgi:hypothetical protein
MPAPSAAPSRDHRFHEEASVILAKCKGFRLTEMFTLDIRTTTFFNQQGDAVRTTLHVNFVGVITNSASGNTYRDSADHTVTRDLTTGEETTVGLIFNVVVPGVGPVAHDTGKIVVDANDDVTFVGGPHTVSLGTAQDPCTVLV